MLGAIVGDIVGSIYEMRNHRSKDFPFFGANVSFTDDTVCTIASADALLKGADPARTLREWCRRYPARGYGGMFLRWIYSLSPEPYNSFGNGAAMRVSGAAWIAQSLQEALMLSDRITAVTHNHPEGLKGAQATCHAIFMALEGASAAEIAKAVTSTYLYDLARSVDEIRQTYKFDESCQGTVPQALTCALTANDFEDAIRNAISIGGDSDTVAAIAGSVAEPLFGIPENIASAAREYLPAEFLDVVDRVRKAHEAVGK